MNVFLCERMTRAGFLGCRVRTQQLTAIGCDKKQRRDFPTSSGRVMKSGPSDNSDSEFTFADNTQLTSCCCINRASVESKNTVL